MIPRDLTKHLVTAVKKFPVVGVVGPRQSGKTTLVRATFPKHRYVSLEELDNRLFAQEDPRGFLSAYTGPVILDEVQKVPEMFSYLQTRVDETNKPGQYILTGSQHFLLHERISQTLAGRIALFTLFPLTISEVADAGLGFDSYEEFLFTGMYPRLYKQRIASTAWYPSYIQTAIERDIRDLRQIDDLSTFQTFVKLCAGRIGQLLNLSSLARDCGISHNTARSWISLLETSFIIFLLRPYHENISKRLVKMPKLFFSDTGVACSLLGIRRPEDVATHYLKGGLFENFVIAELWKQKFHRQLPIEYFFWRDRRGHEVDLLGTTSSGEFAVEIKAGKTMVSGDLSDLSFFSTTHKHQKELKKFLIYGGNQTLTRSDTFILGQHDLLKGKLNNVLAFPKLESAG